jgi:hypothetical protein
MVQVAGRIYPRVGPRRLLMLGLAGCRRPHSPQSARR